MPTGSATTEWRYDAFISYRRSDGAAVANWLRREIQAFKPPRSLVAKSGHRLKVYLDTAYERGTSDFYEREIRPALLASRHLIVLATPDAVRRREGVPDWIQREVEDFGRGPNGSNVMVVRAAGEFNDPLPADLAARFPNIEIVDLRGAQRFWYLHPARAARISNEKLKIVAPLLEISSDDMPLLRQEEERRQQVRLGSISGIAAAVLLAVGGLSIYALQSSWRAEDALRSSMDATGRMVLTIARSLDRTGPNATLRTNMLNEGCDLIDRLRRTATREPGVQQMVTCLVERAVEHERQDEHSAADSLLASAIEWAVARINQSASPEAASASIRARDAKARVLSERKDLEGAKAELLRVVADAEAFAAKYEDKDDFVSARAEALSALADLYLQSGEADKAGKALDDAAAAIGSLRGDGSEDQQRQRALLQASYLQRAAEANFKRDDLGATLERLRAALDVRRTVRAAGQVALQNELAMAELLVFVAAIEIHSGHGEAAQVARTEAQERLAKVAAAGPLSSAVSQRIEQVRERLARLADLKP